MEKPQPDSETSFLTAHVNGIKVWRNNKGELHRLDGPAIEYVDGSKEWWIHSEFIVRVEPKKNR